MSPNFTFILEIMDAVSSGLKRWETFQCVASTLILLYYYLFSSKASIADGMGLHKCIREGQLACFRRHYECGNVYNVFRTTYAPLQMMSILGEDLCISAGKCKIHTVQLLQQFGFEVEESGC